LPGQELHLLKTPSLAWRTDALAEVNGRHGQKDATLGRELQHQRDSRNAWTSAASAGAVSLYVIRRRVPSGR